MAPATGEAFDLSKESDATRERYGRNLWGQRCLLARRLVESGVDLAKEKPVLGIVALAHAGEGFFRISAFNSRANVEEVCKRIAELQK